MNRRIYATAIVLLYVALSLLPSVLRERQRTFATDPDYVPVGIESVVLTGAIRDQLLDHAGKHVVLLDARVERCEFRAHSIEVHASDVCESRFQIDRLPVLLADGPAYFESNAFEVSP